MPRKNVPKQYVEDGFYHIYSRGVDKQRIFRDDKDYAVFLNLFKRYLSLKQEADKKNREYPHYGKDLELLAYCLMPNHFHAFIYQKNPNTMTELFRSINTTYSMYFNKKYGRVGPLFQSAFRASLVTTEGYYTHISRYIHLNPKDYKSWRYSSLPYYLGKQQAEWLRPDRIMSDFDGPQDYAKFCEDSDDHREMLDELKYELADSDISRV